VNHVVVVAMVSRKRNQGKARKAAKAKAREEAVERRRNNQATIWPQQLLEAQMQMQQLQIGNAPTGRDTTTCRHGLEKIDNICVNFMHAFEDAAFTDT